MSYYFTMIFVHMPVIAAVCYLSVYKLIEWNPVNIYLFEVNSRNIRNMCEIFPDLTKNIAESCSGDFIVNFEHILHFFSVFIVDFE